MRAASRNNCQLQGMALSIPCFLERKMRMCNKDVFSSYHPMINFIYFALILVCTMFFMHPIFLVISLLSALCYAVELKGKKAVQISMLYLLPMMLMAAIINPVFSHEGATILTYLPSGNPLTLENIIYGMASSVMLAAVITWFACYSEVMTSDKFVYLFGRVIPALSLVLSMILRFVPKFKNQFRIVSEAQNCVGRDISDGTMLQRLKNAITIFSIMITWSLENAIETADSMKSRGYGLEGRTAYSIYQFDKRDKRASFWLILCGAVIFIGWITKQIEWRYYPTMEGAELSPMAIIVFVIYVLLCFTPVIMNRREAAVWRHLKSEI